MVKLIGSYLTEGAEFQKCGIEVPTFDQEMIKQNADKKPVWVHFGGGNLFRCFHAAVAQKLLDSKEMTSGLIVAETYDEEVIEKIYQRYDNRFLSVTMKSDGSFDKTLIASVAESIYFNEGNTAGWDRLIDIFENPSLQLATLTITEKGYSLHDSLGRFTDQAVADMSGTSRPKTNIGALTHLLYKRYQSGATPIALVSTDNFSENGQKLADAIFEMANGWLVNGKVDSEFVDYIKNPEKVSFPWSMIDRITPNPSEIVATLLKHDGFEDTTLIETAKHTKMAPFGNTEEVHYLVIEDAFPNGRPAFEKAGVLLTDRETVNNIDQMKVTACLNPLHTALAIFGCLFAYQSIADEMTDPDLVALIQNLGYGEGLPVVKDPIVINPKDFIDQLLTKRLPNKNMPDTPQRIAADTSQKIPIRYGQTIQSYIENPLFCVADLEFIPLIIAGWLRYLIAKDDALNAFTPSSDPLLNELQNSLHSIKLDGSKQDIHTILRPILNNREIFPQDLYQIGIASKVETYFEQMCAGKGAIRATLQKTLNAHGKTYILAD